MEFKPKTRKQIYKAMAQEIGAPDYDYVPKVDETIYLTSAVDNETPLKDIPLTFEAGTGELEGNYAADIGATNDRLPFAPILVTVNGEEIPIQDAQESGIVYKIIENSPSGHTFTAISIGSTAPVGTFVASVFYMQTSPDMSKLAPKTREEKYLAAIANLYNGELPEPKTVDEYILATKAGRTSDDDDAGWTFDDDDMEESINK